MLKGPAQGGAALIEALVAILIVSFGLMALAGLQADIDQAVGDAYERLAGALAAGSEIPVAVETVRQLMFLEKLHQSIDDAQFDLEDR